MWSYQQQKQCSQVLGGGSVIDSVMWITAKDLFHVWNLPFLGTGAWLQSLTLATVPKQSEILQVSDVSLSRLWYFWNSNNPTVKRGDHATDKVRAKSSAVPMVQCLVCWGISN